MMHIPSLAVSGAPCPVTSVVAGVGVVVALYTACRSRRKPSLAKFAVVSSLICFAQLFDFPFQGIVPGHLVGGVLAVALLGIPFGVLAMVSVVSFQCLFLGDGGLSALGANIIHMAFIASGFGGLIKGYLSKHNMRQIGRYMILSLSAWGSIVAASVFCALTLTWDHSALVTKSIIEIVEVHLIIGFWEALATVIVAYLYSIVLRSAFYRQPAVPLLTP
jgi:cobalt/nickel transport system permease protein